MTFHTNCWSWFSVPVLKVTRLFLTPQCSRVLIPAISGALADGTVKPVLGMCSQSLGENELPQVCDIVSRSCTASKSVLTQLPVKPAGVTQAWDFKTASRSILLSLLSWERGDRKGGAELEDWLAEWKDRLSPLTYHLSVRIRAEDCNFLVNAL